MPLLNGINTLLNAFVLESSSLSVSLFLEQHYTLSDGKHNNNAHLILRSIYVVSVEYGRAENTETHENQMHSNLRDFDFRNKHRAREAVRRCWLLGTNCNPMCRTTIASHTNTVRASLFRPRTALYILHHSAAVK